jgi:hypothetical protein
MQLTGENQPNKLRGQALVIFESLYGTAEQHSDNDDNGGGGDGKSKNCNKKSNTKTFKASYNWIQNVLERHRQLEIARSNDPYSKASNNVTEVTTNTVTTTLEIATGETEATVPKASNRKSPLDDPAHSSKNLNIYNTNNHSQSDVRYGQNRPRIYVGYRQPRHLLQRLGSYIHTKIMITQLVGRYLDFVLLISNVAYINPFHSHCLAIQHNEVAWRLSIPWVTMENTTFQTTLVR